MAKLAATGRDFGAILADAARDHPVAGCALSIWQDGHTTFASIGHADGAKAVRVSPGTVFSIFSITKVFTATLVMMAVEDGRLALDTSVETLFGPSFSGITVRHLLTHTSGVPGDVMAEAGEGADCIDAYIAHVAAMPRFHAPGALVSYCNAGFVILGGILERLYGEPFEALLRRRLLDPLGIASGRSGPDVAVTHLPTASGDKLVPTDAAYARALAPAGAALQMTAEELLRFARLHLGTIDPSLLAQVQRLDMTRLEAAFPAGLRTRGFGLGWMLDSVGGQEAIGHDGASMTFLRIFPEDNTAIALLTNGGAAAAFRDKVFRALFGQAETSRKPTASVAARQAYNGCYANLGFFIEVHEGRMRVTAVPGATSTTDSRWRDMIPLGGDVFALGHPEGERVAFTVSEGRIRWLHFGVRAFAPLFNSRMA